MMSEKQLILFSSILGNILKLNIPITKALTLLKTEINNTTLKKKIEKIYKSINKGKTLSSALYENKIDTNLIYFVKAGEISGKLSNVLLKYSEIKEEKNNNYYKFKALLIYPIILLSFVIMIFIFLNINFFTILRPEHLNAKVNILAQSFVFIFHLFVKYKIFFSLILLIFLLFIFLNKLFFRIIPLKICFDFILFNIPIINNLIWNLNLSKFCFISGHLLNRNINTSKSFELALNSTNNFFIKKHLNKLIKKISNNFNAIDLNGSDKVPDLIIQAMFIGMKNENLNIVMSEISELYIEKYKTKMIRFFYLFPAFLFIFLGIIILILALGIFVTYWNFIFLLG